MPRIVYSSPEPEAAVLPSVPFSVNHREGRGSVVTSANIVTPRRPTGVRVTTHPLDIVTQPSRTVTPLRMPSGDPAASPTAASG